MLWLVVCWTLNKKKWPTIETFRFQTNARSLIHSSIQWICVFITRSIATATATAIVVVVDDCCKWLFENHCRSNCNQISHSSMDTSKRMVGKLASNDAYEVASKIAPVLIHFSFFRTKLWSIETDRSNEYISFKIVKLAYDSTVDRKRPLNLTSHCNGQSSILDHLICQWEKKRLDYHDYHRVFVYMYVFSKIFCSHLAPKKPVCLCVIAIRPNLRFLIIYIHGQQISVFVYVGPGLFCGLK